MDQNKSKEENLILDRNIKKYEKNIELYKELLKEERKLQLTYYSVLTATVLATGYCVLQDFNTIPSTAVALKGLSVIALTTSYAMSERKKEVYKDGRKENSVVNQIHLTYINLSYLLPPICSICAIYRGASIISSSLVLISTKCLCESVLTIRRQQKKIGSLKKKRDKLITTRDIILREIDCNLGAEHPKKVKGRK